ncbi:hypothetical protein OROMI_022939 [Orobanche minor]
MTPGLITRVKGAFSWKQRIRMHNALFPLTFWKLDTAAFLKAVSHETSWADQWDPQNSYKDHSSNSPSSSKFSSKLDKTKVAASTGFKKVKNVTTAGFHWIKQKYQKTTQKH